MADVSYQTAQQKWLADMASGNRGSGKIDRGPLETTASKVGRQAPKRGGNGGRRVPPPSAAFARKLGP